MHRALLAVLAAGVVLGVVTAPSQACHFGGLGCGAPENQPFDPQPFASVADNRTSAHSSVTFGFTQQAHEQFIQRLEVDFPAGLDFDLDRPALNEKLADISIKAIVSGAQTTLTGRIKDHNDSAHGHPSGGVYHWLAEIDSTTPGQPPSTFDVFVNENAPDGHLRLEFTVPDSLRQTAESVDASLLEVRVTFLSSVGAGFFLTNPATAGTYTVTATMTARDDPDTPETPPTVTRSASFDIVDRVPKTVDLTPATAVRQVGETHTVTATVRDQKGEALAGADVDVDVTSGPHTGPVCTDLTTGGDGKTSCSYTGSAPGDDALKATATNAGTSALGTATVDWDAPTSLALSPGSASRQIGQTHTVTATLTDDDGAAVAGEPVGFEVVTGPHAGRTGSGTTDANGRASFSYVGEAEGTDAIRASSAGLEATAGVTWTAAPVLGPAALTMTPERVLNAYMGTQEVTFTALVTDQHGQALPGVDVHFEVTSGPNAGAVAGDGTTGADGKVSFSYTGLRENGEGTDTLEASVPGTALTDTSTVKWDSDPCDDPDLEADQPFDFTFRPDAEASIQGQTVEQDACVKT